MPRACLPPAGDFSHGRKVTKSPLRTCGSKDSLCLTWTLVLPVLRQTSCLRRRSDVTAASESALRRAGLAGRRLPAICGACRTLPPGAFRQSLPVVFGICQPVVFLCRCRGGGCFAPPGASDFCVQSWLRGLAHRHAVLWLPLWGRSCAPLSLGSPFGGAVGEADGGGTRQEPFRPIRGHLPHRGRRLGGSTAVGRACRPCFRCLPRPARAFFGGKGQRLHAVVA